MAQNKAISTRVKIYQILLDIPISRSDEESSFLDTVCHALGRLFVRPRNTEKESGVKKIGRSPEN